MSEGLTRQLEVTPYLSRPRHPSRKDTNHRRRSLSSVSDHSRGGWAQWRSNDTLSRAGTVEFISRSHRERDPRSGHNGGRYYDRDREYHLQVGNETEEERLPSLLVLRERNETTRREEKQSFAQPYHVRNPSTGLISRVWLCSYLLYCAPTTARQWFISGVT